MQPDEKPEDVPEEVKEAIISCIGMATAKIAERRVQDLGILSLKAAEAGTGFCLCAQFRDPRKAESKQRALVFALSGPVPDDLLQLIQDYLSGAVQDYANGNKDVRIMFEDRSVDTEEDND